MAVKHKMVCSSCGSENVKRDAWATWCQEEQEWVVDNVFDDAYCEECDAECSIFEEVMDPDVVV